MTSSEVSKRTGIPRGTIAKWVNEGLVRPRGGQSFGPGDPLYFDEADVARLRALAAVKRAFGDGELVKTAIEQLPTVTTYTTELRVVVKLPLDAV